ncbi:MAG: M16 family metallopeptidase [bacterium]
MAVAPLIVTGLALWMATFALAGSPDDFGYEKAGHKKGVLKPASKAGKPTHFPPLPEYNPQPVERRVLSNGIVVFLMENHEFPTIDITMRVRGGSMYEPADKVGLTGQMGSSWRSGGSTNLSGDDLDERLERIAASIGGGAGSDSGNFSISCMKDSFDETLGYFSDLVLHPAFPQDKIDLAKIQARAGIQRRNDSAGGIAGREYARLMYGPDHPFARISEYRTIDAVTRDDIVGFYTKYMKPDAAIIGAWGDFNSADLIAKLEKAFADWKPGKGNYPAVADIRPTKGPGVYFVQKDDVTQSTVMMGHITGRLDDPDYPYISLWNQVLSGGFNSRMFSTIRSKYGYAYSTGASIGLQYDRPGYFTASAGTKSESTVAAAKAIIEVVTNAVQGPITPDELRIAKDAVLNSSVFQYNTPAQLVGRAMTYEFYGYPQDFLEKYLAKVKDAEIDDLLDAAKKMVTPENFVIFVLGRAQDFDASVDTIGFGPTHTIDITVPPPESK